MSRPLGSLMRNKASQIGLICVGVVLGVLVTLYWPDPRDREDYASAAWLRGQVMDDARSGRHWYWRGW